MCAWLVFLKYGWVCVLVSRLIMKLFIRLISFVLLLKLLNIGFSVVLCGVGLGVLVGVVIVFWVNVVVLVDSRFRFSVSM